MIRAFAVAMALAELLLVAFLVYDSSSRSWGYVAVDLVLIVGGVSVAAFFWRRRRRGSGLKF